MQKRRLNVARVSKGERLGPTNQLKIAAEGVISRFLLFSSFPLPTFFIFSPSLSRSQFIEALGTCHLSRGSRTRAFYLHLGTGHRNSRRTSSCPIEKKQRRRSRKENTLKHFAASQFQNNARLKRRNVFQGNWRKKLHLPSAMLFWEGITEREREREIFQEIQEDKDFFFVIISLNSKLQVT